MIRLGHLQIEAIRKEDRQEIRLHPWNHYYIVTDQVVTATAAVYTALMMMMVRASFFLSLTSYSLASLPPRCLVPLVDTSRQKSSLKSPGKDLHLVGWIGT